MSEWREFKLKDLCEKVTVGYVGPMADQYLDGGVTFLRSLNIKPFRIELNDVKFVSEEFHHQIKKSALRPGDVAVVRTGYPGTAAVIPNTLPVSNCSDLVIVRPGKELNPHFITAIFNSAFGQTLVSGNTVGAAQQHFNITVAKELRFRVPPKPVQDKIAAVLSAYDELIEVNRRRIGLLEKLAEELYREWFVRLRFPGHEKTKIVKGVPQGWTHQKLPEVAEITYGFAFDGKRFNSDKKGKPIIRIRNIPTSTTLDYTDEHAPERCLVQRGDLIVGMDGEFHINRWHGPEAWLVQRVCRLRAKSKLLEGYLGHSVRGPIKHYESILLGATIGHLGAMHLKTIEMLIPSEPFLKHLAIFNQIDKQIGLLEQTCRQLTRTRDLLLPRLISGKLRVEDLDIQFPPGMETAN